VSDLIVAIAGTPAGARLAVALALVSALAHALFGALQKGRHDAWLMRAAIDMPMLAVMLPVALMLVPRPQGVEWLLLGGAVVVHFAYKLTVAMAYDRGAFTVVYPVIRGTGPLATVAVAAMLFDEHFNAAQWAGVAMLSAAMLALAAVNLRGAGLARARLGAALGWAVAGGLLVAAYTAWDTLGIRTTPDPFTFLAWFFVVTSIDFPLLMARRVAALPAAERRRLLARGAAGAASGLFSFGGIMLATRLDTVGEAAVLRETSVVFAAVLGRLMLGERVGPARTLLMVLIAAGAAIVNIGR
jgi:drug/metabolite transporter (DMT)-like permease